MACISQDASPPSERWERVKDVFNEALMHAPRWRHAFLDGACEADGELRREVESLLAAHDAAGPFLSGAADLRIDETELDGAIEGRRVGAYRVQDVIGAGGMGTVYRAVRDDDAFQKTVALKLVRGGAPSDAIERRFRQERHILARLDHPNIATILDGGATEEGQPYLVMEYVGGRPITEYCDEQGLGTRERLALFATACAAVHHAHQNRVVHRDLKPGNILVTPDGTLKLLDFGIAKLLALDTAPDCAPTASLAPVMTPEYASPEQVRGEPVTTASDVYSLGVLLYELLAGRRPYGLRAESLEEIVRCVCETDPQPPSSVARTRAADQATTIGGPARPAASELRGDLDTIVLKALRKEPERRYPSALALAEDVQRHLAGKPVRARPDTLRYRTVKFVGRHRAAVAATALLIGALLAGLFATTRQARIAGRERARAERRFEDTRALASTLLFRVHDLIRDLPGSTPAREELATVALGYLERLSAEAGSDLDLQAEIASAYERLAEIQGTLVGTASRGETDQARASLDRALAIREAVAAARPRNAADRLALAGSLGRLGRWASGAARFEEASRHAERQREIVEPLAAAGGDEALAALADAYANSAAAHFGRHDDLSGLRATDHNVELRRQIALRRPDSPARCALASALRVRGASLAQLGSPADGSRDLREAIGLLEGIAATHVNDARAARELGIARQVLGRLLAAQGSSEEALAMLGSALSAADAAASADPTNFNQQLLAAGMRIELAVSLSELGRPEAVVAGRQALAHVDRLVRGRPEGMLQSYLVRVRQEMAGILLARARSRATTTAQRAAWLREARGHVRLALHVLADLNRRAPAIVPTVDDRDLERLLAGVEAELRASRRPDASLAASR